MDSIQAVGTQDNAILGLQALSPSYRATADEPFDCDGGACYTTCTVQHPTFTAVPRPRLLMLE